MRSGREARLRAEVSSAETDASDIEHRARLHDQMRYPPALQRAGSGDLAGSLVMMLLLGAIGIMVVAVVILLAWWTGAHDTLRSILESSPLTGAVADRPRQSGDAALVAGATIGVVLAAAIAVSLWRRRLADRCAFGEISWLWPAGATLLRSVILVGGLTAVPVFASIAAGNDLRHPNEESLPEIFAGLLPIGIVGVSILALRWSRSSRRWRRRTSGPNALLGEPA